MPHAATLPTRRPLAENYLFLLALALLGYALMGKGFAYWGLPPLFIGEVLLAAGLGVLCFSRGIGVKFLQAFPIPFLLLYMLWCAARTFPYVSRYGIDALRDGMIWGYGAYAVVVAALLIAVPARIQLVLTYYRKFAYAFLIFAPPLWIISSGLGDALPRLPWADVPVILMKGGDMCVHLAGIFAFVAIFENALPPLLPLVLMPINLMLNIKGRAGMVSFLVGAAITTVCRPLSKFIPRYWLAVVFGLVLFWATSLRVSMGSEERQISFDQLMKNFQSIVSDKVDDEQLSGSKEWRLRWWHTIEDYTLHGPYFWTGKGFGINLADDDGFQVSDDNSLRNPHNGHYTILARAGVPGFCLWALAQLVWGGSVAWSAIQAKRQKRRVWNGLFIFLLAYWAAFMCNTSFDVFIEGPMGAIWLWSVYGVGAAAVYIHRHHPDALPDSAEPVRPAALAAPRRIRVPRTVAQPAPAQLFGEPSFRNRMDDQP